MSDKRNMMGNKQLNKKGMTLIEVMIALFVFAVGILGVLKLTISTMSTGDTIKLKTTANMLAKQNMEILFHQRNSNRISSQIWDCLEENEDGSCKRRLGDFISGTNKNKNIIIPSFDEEMGYKFYKTGTSETFINQWKRTRLSIFTGNDNIKKYKYCENNCGEKSFFGSFVKVDKIKHLPREDLLSGNIYKITSKCLYIKGGTTGEVMLESFIANLDK